MIKICLESAFFPVLKWRSCCEVPKVYSLYILSLFKQKLTKPFKTHNANKEVIMVITVWGNSPSHQMSYLSICLYLAIMLYIHHHRLNKVKFQPFIYFGIRIYPTSKWTQSHIMMTKSNNIVNKYDFCKNLNKHMDWNIYLYILLAC